MSTLRGHMDSVNAVHFLPFSNSLISASADKTLCRWDSRTVGCTSLPFPILHLHIPYAALHTPYPIFYSQGLCVQTFYGHQNSCNDVTSDLKVSLQPTLQVDSGLELMLLSTGTVPVLVWSTGWCSVLGHAQCCGSHPVLGPVTICCPLCSCGPSRQSAGLCWGRWPHHHTRHHPPAGEAIYLLWVSTCHAASSTAGVGSERS